MPAITADQFTTALDYLPVAIRAAERNPGNDILWAEAVRAQRAIITYADTLLTEPGAASVQAAVGTIARLAVIDIGDLYDHPTTIGYAIHGEHAKSHIRALIASA